MSLSSHQTLQSELDSTTKNIVQEIMRECTNRNIQVNEKFVIHYVKLLMLNPAWGIMVDRLPNRNDVQRFVKHCSEYLSEQIRPSFIILKMQNYFFDSFESIDKVIENGKVVLEKRLAPLLKEIVSTNTHDSHHSEKLLKKILYWIILNSGLGNPTHAPVLDETQAALKSIYTSEDLTKFIDLSPERKRLQLMELTELVAGIRLFNRDCGKSGSGIEHLPSMLTDAIEVTKTDIKRNLDVLLNISNILTTAVENCYRIYSDKKLTYVFKWEIPEGISELDMDYIKDLLVLYRQYELFVRKIEVAVIVLEKKFIEIFKSFKDAMFKLHKTVEFRIAIPTVQVFPHFANLYEIWSKIQDKTILLSQINKVLLTLQSLVKNLEGSVAVTKMVGAKGPVTDEERLKRSTNYIIPPISNLEIINPNDIENFDEASLQYLGFCAWTFVETGGALIPGFPNMGVVKYRNMMFVFSCPEAAVAFGVDPCRYILRGLQLVRDKPELIHFLRMYDQMVAVNEVEHLVVEIEEKTETRDVGISTELHPIESNIDPNYMWNIWDWKRQALMFADISKRATWPTQTHLSCGWNSVGTQTQQKRDKIQQTKRDCYTNVPTVSNFLYGLRGTKDDKYHILTLTRPTDEAKEDDWVNNKNFYFK